MNAGIQIPAKRRHAAARARRAAYLLAAGLTAILLLVVVPSEYQLAGKISLVRSGLGVRRGVVKDVLPESDGNQSVLADYAIDGHAATVPVSLSAADGKFRRGDRIALFAADGRIVTAATHIAALRHKARMYWLAFGGFALLFGFLLAESWLALRKVGKLLEPENP